MPKDNPTDAPKYDHLTIPKYSTSYGYSLISLLAPRRIQPYKARLLTLLWKRDVIIRLNYLYVVLGIDHHYGNYCERKFICSTHSLKRTFQVYTTEPIQT